MVQRLSDRVVEVCAAMGVEPGAHGYGRPLEAEVFPLVRDDTGEGYVSLKVSNPLLVYALSVNQSIALAHEIMTAALEAKRWEEHAGGAAT
ncbi:MAG: hypothetical protein U1D69_14915 [Polynucleobacter sp.]|nr:hypothetical protein [Polynucleobacter sp.]